MALVGPGAIMDLGWGLRFLSFLVVVFSFGAQASYSDRYQIGELTDADLRWPDLVRLVEGLPEQSLESALQELKLQHPNLFREYVLMYKSRSLQSASFQFPRVILVGKAAEMVITFNGHHRQSGYQNLEIMHFLPEENKFEFREIEFRDGKVQFSQANPVKCMNCHQASSRRDQDPRPNWEPYNVWPGAYGSVGHTSSVTDSPSQPRYDQELADLKRREEKELTRFLAQQLPQHERYRFLEPFQNIGSEKYPRFFTADSRHRIPNSMPTRITHGLALLNFRRVARILRESPLYPDYKETILGALRCKHYYMPAKVYNWHSRRYFRQEESQYNSVHPSAHLAFGFQAISSVPEVFSFLFEPYGFDTSDWSMDFGSGGRFGMQNRFGTPNVLEQDLLKALREVWGDDPSLTQSCQDLSEISKRKLSKLDLSDSMEGLPIPNHERLLRQCLSCHNSQEALFYGAPVIPFEDPQQLAVSLQKTGYTRGTLLDEILYRTGPHATFKERMPANGSVPSEMEIERLHQYLKSLAGDPRSLD